MKHLIALIVIAAGLYFENQPKLEPGEAFEAPTDAADRMVADGAAKLADAVTAPASDARRTPKKVKIRLLVDSAAGNANDVVEVDSDVAKALEAEKAGDTSKPGIAYALTLDQNKPEA